MSYMEQGSKAKIKPPMLTIIGFPGAGKTSLAGLFPSPAFIQAEDSQTVFENTPEEQQPFFMPMLPEAKKHKDNPAKNISTKAVLIEQIKEFGTQDHPYKTLIFDTATSLNGMLERELVEFDESEALSVQDAAGGFQKGYDIIATWHYEIISLCNRLRNAKGMAIIFLAHTANRKVKNHPELSGEYNVYGMDMHVKSKNNYINLVDAAIYLKQEEIATGHKIDKKDRTLKTGRITQTGDRVLITSSDGVVGYVDAKTRYDMPNEIPVPLGENPLLQYIPFFNKGEVK